MTVATYEHTQSTIVPFIVTETIFLTVVTILLITGTSVLAIVVTGGVFSVAALLAFTFSRMTVTVDEGAVIARFGSGWPRRTIPVEEIGAARPVRNRWYHGWGIRKVGRGWMFNVWGLDAVELELRSGRAFRIGTDEPRELAAAVADVTR